MSKILATVAAFALTSILALPGAANATARKADGVRTADSVTTTDVSARRRHFRHGYMVRRHAWGPRWRHAWGPRWRHAWGPRYGYWGPRYGAYAYDPFYRPAWGPRAFIGGPGIGVSFGAGPRWW